MNGLKSFLSGIPSRLSGRAPALDRDAALAQLGRRLVQNAHMEQGEGARGPLSFEGFLPREGTDPEAFAQIRRAFLVRDTSWVREAISAQSAFFPLVDLEAGEDLVDAEKGITIKAVFDLSPQMNRDVETPAQEM